MYKKQKSEQNDTVHQKTKIHILLDIGIYKKDKMMRRPVELDLCVKKSRVGAGVQ